MKTEAEVFARYLLGVYPGSEISNSYNRLLTGSGITTEKVDLFVQKYPGTLYLLDPACALFRPRASLRKKLQLMMAILECRPEYVDLFLPPAAAQTNLFLLSLRACWSGCRAIPGALLLIFL